MAELATTGPLHERVYSHLCDALMRGEFAPSQRLTLRALAEDLGTSIAPVREAVSRLATLNAVNVFPKRFIEVAPLTAETYMEIVEIRQLLEGHAAARACLNMTADQIDKLEQINQRLLELAADGQVDRSMIENQRFHFTVYEAAGSNTLLENIKQVWIRVGPSVNQLLTEEYSQDTSGLRAGFANHETLIAAMRKGDSKLATQAIVDDISISSERMLQNLKRRSELSLTTLETVSGRSTNF
jgi:DNA-binding GntR family transcriptional regulator